MSASRQKKLRNEQKATVSETKARQSKEDKKAARQLKIWSAIFYVAVIAIVVGLLIGGVANSGIVHRMVTAATVGEHKISAAELNYFYIDAVNANSFLPYLVDSDKGLDEQIYNDEEGTTWADYYLEQAVLSAKSMYAVYDEAMAKGFTLSEEGKNNIDLTISNMEAYAALYGYSSANAMVRNNYGIGCNLKTYEKYLTVSQTATEYATAYGESLTATPEEISADLEENGINYTAFSYRYVTLETADFYKGEADEEGNYTEKQTEAAVALAKREADTLAKEMNGQADAFAENEDSVLAEDVAYSSVPAAMTEWLTAAERTEGETTVIETSNGNGYYVLMYLGTNDNSGIQPIDVRHILISFDGETDDEGNPTEESIATAYEEAQNILDEWMAGDATAESFGELANEHSTDTGSNTTGGLYEAVYPGQMVTNFNDWCFDESRKPGDTGLVESEYGVHVMYFVQVNEEELNYRDYQAETTIVNEKYETWMTELSDAMTSSTGKGMKLVNKNIYINTNTSSY